MLLGRMSLSGVRLQRPCLQSALLPLAQSAAGDPDTYAPVLEILLAQPGCAPLFLHLDCPGALLGGVSRRAGGQAPGGRSSAAPADNRDRLVCMAVDAVRGSHAGRRPITVVTPSFSALIADVWIERKRHRYVSFAYAPGSGSPPVNMLYAVSDGALDMLEIHLPEPGDGGRRHPGHVRGKVEKSLLHGSDTLHTESLVGSRASDPPPPEPGPPSPGGGSETAPADAGAEPNERSNDAKKKKKSRGKKKAGPRPPLARAPAPAGGEAETGGGAPEGRCPACARAAQTCLICDTDDSDHACNGCGHTYACQACAVLHERTQPCPDCKNICGFFRVYRTYVEEQCLACGESTRELCVVCQDRPIAQAYTPCGHMCICGACGPRWVAACPFCMQNGVRVAVSPSPLDA